MRRLVGLGIGFLALAQVGVASELTIMSYNVENLFDVTHDEGKEDWEYTPISTQGKKEYCQNIKIEKYKKGCLESDWKSEQLSIKLAQIKRAVFSHNQKLPDVLGLSEVENPNVVEMLRQELGYEKFVMTNSPDHRGIDVAILFNEGHDLKFLGHREHVMTGESFKDKPTRNILEAHFALPGGETLAIFNNHWPSQAAPGAIRTEVASQVASLVDAFMGKSKGAKATLLMGDFNTLPTDVPHPFHNGLFNAQTKLHDIHSTFMTSKFINSETKNYFSRGTYFYAPEMNWNLFDRFFVSENLLDGKGSEVLLHSYKILNQAELTTTIEYKDPKDPNFGSVIVGAPKKYDHRANNAEAAGFSDHFPIVITIAVGSH